MRSSIVSKTIVALPFIFFLSQAKAESTDSGLVGAADRSMGVASPSAEVSSPLADGSSSPAVPVDAMASVAAYDSLKCLKLEAGQGLGIEVEWKDAATFFDNQAKMCGQAFPPDFQVASQKYLENRQACIDRNQSAGRNCLEKCSPHIQGMVSGAQLLMAGMSQLSITDSCSKMGQAMKLAQMGMSAFSVSCGAQKALCDTSCGAAVEALEAAKKILQKPVVLNPALVDSCQPLKPLQDNLIRLAEQELLPTAKLSVAGKKLECTEYTANLVAAGAGLLSALQQGRQANACEKATKGTQAGFASGAADPCTVAATKDSAQCICKANPRSPGCEMSTNLSGDGSGGFGHKGDGKSSAGLSSGSGLGADSGLSNSGSIGGGGPSGAAPPVGGGGGSAGLGSGNSGSNDGRGANDTITKTNTSIYGGEGGGGGGGAFGSRGGGGAQKTAAYNTAFAQKISADREIASLRNQVSSQGGKSNWEKVKDRYTQEKTNLLGR